MKQMITLLIACIVSLFIPQMADAGTSGLQLFNQKLVKAVVPAFSYQEDVIEKEITLQEQAEYENKLAAASGGIKDADGTEESFDNEAFAGTEENTDNAEFAGTEETSDNASPAGTEETSDNASPAGAEDNSGTSGSMETTDASDSFVTSEIVDTSIIASSDETAQTLLEKMKDFDYLVQNYYIVDSSTTIRSTDLDAEKLLSENLTVDKTVEGPQILIYHTHSQEGYLDSGDGDTETSVVALGEKLSDILTERYGFRVLHHAGEYDVGDRDHAYSNAAPVIEQLLLDNPTIEVVIDLHRDSVQEDSRLVTTIDGKETAKIMFFNGLCRTAAGGDLTTLQNPYLEDNLAFSLQMQIAATQKYPDFTRKIYLKGYRYNMHFCPKSLLVEVGAQNNTFEEAVNAMEPLAELLAEVLGSSN